MQKTISVNDPLRYGGITIYQTDWSFSALQILKDGEGPFNLAMAPLKINGDKKLFGTFLPVGDTDSPNVKGMYVSFLRILIGTSANLSKLQEKIDLVDGDFIFGQVLLHVASHLNVLSSKVYNVLVVFSLFMLVVTNSSL